MEAYKKKDEEMDVVLDEIIMGVQEVRKGVQNINEKQDQINTKVVDQNKQANKMNKRIERDNDKLKVIIQKVLIYFTIVQQHEMLLGCVLDAADYRTGGRDY